MINDNKKAEIKETSTAKIACSFVTEEPNSDAPINQSVLIKSLALADLKLGAIIALVGSKPFLPHLISDEITGLQEVKQELAKVEQKDSKGTTQKDYPALLKTLLEETEKVNHAFHPKKIELRDQIADAPDIADFDKKFPNKGRSIQTEVSELYHKAYDLLDEINDERRHLIGRYEKIYSGTSLEDIKAKSLKSPENLGQKARPALREPGARIEHMRAEQKSAPAIAHEKAQPIEQKKDEHKPT